MPAEGFLNYREAAAALGVKPSVIRGLVCQGILRDCSGYRNGVSKLIPAADVRRMCGEHVAVTALAARLGLNGNAFASFIRKSGTPTDCCTSAREGERLGAVRVYRSGCRDRPQIGDDIVAYK